MIIKNCNLTQSDVEVFTDGDKCFGVYKNSVHTGVDIKATSVFSICQGVVIAVYNNDKTHSVIVQYDRNVFFRYSNLLSVDVTKGQTIQQDDKIGDCKSVHFEYLRKDKVGLDVIINLFGVRVYPNDPVPILSGQITYTPVLDPTSEMYEEVLHMGSGE